MSQPPRTLVVVATYNEIDNLPPLVDMIFHHAPKVEILVVDDGSPDGTGRWCDRRGEEDSRLHCLHRPGKLGLGTAVIAGLRYALAHDFDLVVNMDADFSHHPQYLPRFLERMTDPERPPVDVLVGSRYAPGGGIDGWPLRRHVMSRGVNLLARNALGLPVRDCSGSFRCYRAAMLRQLDFDSFHSVGYSFFEEILWRMKRQGAVMEELPIVFCDREAGRSKINRGEAARSLGVILRLGWENWFPGRRR